MRCSLPSSVRFGQTSAAAAVFDELNLSLFFRLQIVSVAEPRQQTQRRFADLHKVDSTLVFKTWQDLHAASEETISTIGRRLADAVVVAVQDHMHKEVVLAFAAQGYNILCEKPMATTLEDIIEIEDAVSRAGIIFGMGHGMHYYTPSIFLFYRDMYSDAILAVQS
jgi:predicted dehydrogenase